MKMARTLIFAAIISTITMGTLPGADFTTGPESCTINWTRSIITARGRFSMDITSEGLPVDHYDGTPVSINAARIQNYERARENALENLMNTLKHLRVDSETRFSDHIKNSPYTRKRISAALNDAARVKKYPVSFDEAYCEIVIGIGEIIATLQYNFPAEDFPSLDNPPLHSEYTSLIIDGRGLKLKPMMFPSVYNEDGLEIYGRIFVDSRYACRYGMVSYCYNEDEARENPRAGKQPLYTVALKNLNGCPVISDRDARKVLAGGTTRNNLKKCRVIIILDKNGETRN